MNYLSSGVSGLLRFTLVNLLRNWVVNFNRGRWSVYSGICGQFTPFFPTTLTIKGKKVKIGDDVSAKLFNYLEKGISYGSHTIPALSLPPQEGTHRILHIHNNVPGVLSEINTTLSKNKINILGQYLKTNDTIGYVVLDVDKGLSKNAMELLKKVKATIKVRILY